MQNFGSAKAYDWKKINIVAPCLYVSQCCAASWGEHTSSICRSAQEAGQLNSG